jgi:tRNA pseudouridine55 synthase
VVNRVRRTLHEKRVGHAGTLDPMATGVLVVLVGEGTKLSPYLTAEDKRYTARIAFGVSTTTLDAEGEIVAREEVPGDLLEQIRALEHDPSKEPAGRLAAALREEAARTEQIPPAFSSIHVDGERSHRLARAGIEVDLAPRPVTVHSLRVCGAHHAELASIDLDITVSKGYYVRSLARDLGQSLGVPSHLAALRRTRCGTFSVEGAVSTAAAATALRAALLPLSSAASLSLPVARLTDDGVVRARQGKRLTEADFVDPPRAESAGAWLDASEKLVAVGERRKDSFIVVRGFGGGRS